MTAPANAASWPVGRCLLVLGAALFAVACTTTSNDGAGPMQEAAAGPVHATGTVRAIDTDPWAYDGNAVVQVDTAGRGRIDVQLPARWNLCQAAPVDVGALAVGMEVDVVGAAAGGGDVVVCGDPSHRLAPRGGEEHR